MFDKNTCIVLLYRALKEACKMLCNADFCPHAHPDIDSREVCSKCYTFTDDCEECWRYYLIDLACRKERDEND